MINIVKAQMQSKDGKKLRTQVDTLNKDLSQAQRTVQALQKENEELNKKLKASQENAKKLEAKVNVGLRGIGLNKIETVVFKLKVELGALIDLTSNRKRHRCKRVKSLR
jgi:predicted  nucleic acid-binding Zn-ribbon protein